jgi:hypothetical protein
MRSSMVPATTKRVVRMGLYCCGCVQGGARVQVHVCVCVCVCVCVRARARGR